MQAFTFFGIIFKTNGIKMSKHKMEKTTTFELEKDAHHIIDIKILNGFCDPLSCWMDTERPITKEEVLKCVKDGRAELAYTPDLYDSAYGKGKDMTTEEKREAHIKKIAFFVVNDSNRSIDIDVGIPSMGCYISYMIDDGNHRFAGAIIRGDKEIKAKVMGEEAHAKELGLWNPDPKMVELLKRYQDEYSERKEEPKTSSVSKLKI